VIFFDKEADIKRASPRLNVDGCLCPRARGSLTLRSTRG